MKVLIRILALCLSLILLSSMFISCENAQDEESTTEPLLTSEYPVWLKRIEDDVIDARDLDVPKGTVVVSDFLKKEIAKYTDDTDSQSESVLPAWCRTIIWI